MADQGAINVFPKKRRQFRVGDRLEVGDTHQYQQLGLRQACGTPIAAGGRAKCTADGVGIGWPGQVLPAAGDGNQGSIKKLWVSRRHFPLVG